MFKIYDRRKGVLGEFLTYRSTTCKTFLDSVLVKNIVKGNLKVLSLPKLTYV